MALRIVGLALLVTKGFHIPLFHRINSGNIHDATTFSSVTETLVTRYRLFAQNVKGITLVYDKGNNSQEHLDNGSYHFVGSLSLVQHPDLIEIPQSQFHAREYVGYHKRLRALEGDFALMAPHCGLKLLEGRQK